MGCLASAGMDATGQVNDARQHAVPGGFCNYELL
jgi:hypothetical protein